MTDFWTFDFSDDSSSDEETDADTTTGADTTNGGDTTTLSDLDSTANYAEEVKLESLCLVCP